MSLDASFAMTELQKLIERAKLDRAAASQTLQWSDLQLERNRLDSRIRALQMALACVVYCADHRHDNFTGIPSTR